ncbi:cupin domain-containing protein [Tamlana agarivorans]|uniref:Cupin domain-containing protein n=1 Tax=Pseudotamlana agarivorans TaxID=481183 RepID=A0ACC5U575_9FLAO|nr:cupin domain-containing protein [Tamlana agarivorans]MBU2949453.1 cupin domain-containing protein [Tamlana agarivorans]
MDRKQFIVATGAGVGFALFPGLVQCQSDSLKAYEKITSKIVKDTEGEILNVIGDIQTHKLIGSDTGNQIVEWVDNVAPGVGIPPHVHSKEDEIFRVIKGKVEIMVAGKSTVLDPGDIAFAPKEIPHGWKVVGTEKAKMITTAFPAGIEYMFEKLAQLPAGPPDFEKVTSICAEHGVHFV